MNIKKTSKGDQIQFASSDFIYLCVYSVNKIYNLQIIFYK